MCACLYVYVLGGFMACFHEWHLGLQEGGMARGLQPCVRAQQEPTQEATPQSFAVKGGWSSPPGSMPSHLHARLACPMQRGCACSGR